jgi:hypothetical protein
MYRIIVIFFVLIVLFGVVYISNHMGSKSFGPNRVYIENEITNKKITVITKDTIRYLIDGFHHYVPDTNYVKIGISDDYSYGNILTICWASKGKEWVATNTIEILENKLDPKRFIYSSTLEDALGYTDQIETLPDNCTSMGSIL